MATDATGTPTPLGIPTYNINVDAPSGNGFNAAMSEIDTLLQARATLASPALTGTPTAPTPLTADNSTAIATTAFVKAQGYLTSNSVTSVFGRTGAVVKQAGDYAVADITGAAPLASPTFTGTPAAPTPLTSDNSTTIATTAFVKAQGYLTSAPVSTVFGRSGAVVATSGDYTAAQVTNAADKSSSSVQSFAGGFVSTHTSQGIGYATGSGGTVTQATSLATGVTLNSPTGEITLFTTALAGGFNDEFTVTNSSVAAADTVAVSLKSGYAGLGILVYVTAVAAGSFKISIYNPGGLTASSTGVVNFAVIKGATA